jgi:hypothetical protein
VLSPVVFFLLAFSLAVVGLRVLVERSKLLETGVESVFNIVVDPSWHVLLDLDPLVAVDLVKLH